MKRPVSDESGRANCSVSAVTLVLFLVGTAAAQGLSGAADRVEPPGSTLGEGVDCTKVSVDFVDDPSLTREERIAAMDLALARSLSRFDACQTAAQTGTANAPAGGGGVVSSVASGMSGNESAGEGQRAKSAADSGRAEAASAGGGGKWTRPPEATGLEAASNGKIPEDIPPGDNDSVLEAQIRRAALNETDPEMRARLWDEYRRYKGLPPARP